MHTLYTKIVKNNTASGFLILRMSIGLILAAHGSQKLFAWFGGYGLEATGQWMASVGLTPGYLMALLAGSAEFFGGIALMLGLLTRFFATVTAFTLLVALFKVHWGNGFFLDTHGIEYALALFSATAALIFLGGGNYSLDHYLFKNKTLGDYNER